MPGQYIYRFLKSTWGIYVDLTADWIAQSDFNGSALEVIPNVYLAIETPNVSMVKQKFLAFAIKLTKDALKEQPSIVIRILDLQLSYTDYADEGLTYALVGWMAQELGIEAALPPPTFDKESKSYVFPDIFSADE